MYDVLFVNHTLKNNCYNLHLHPRISENTYILFLRNKKNNSILAFTKWQ